MLLGIVRWGDVYETPSGAVFYSNLTSEIIFLELLHYNSLYRFNYATPVSTGPGPTNG